MTVTVTTRPGAPRRSTVVLREEDLGHYDEFRRFFVDTFDLGGGLPAGGGDVPCVEVVGGGIYELVFLGRSGKPYPSGVEVRALTEPFEPLDADRVDRDLWEILRWVVGNVGEPWSLDDLERTGMLYRVRWAAPPDDRPR